MVVDVDEWWDDQETASEWLTETEKTLTGEKPLASSVVIVEEQERGIKVSTIILLLSYRDCNYIGHMVASNDYVLLKS